MAVNGMLTNGLLLAMGVGVLYFGAEWLVRGATRLASSLGVPPIVVGLTVVSMGTSAPELVVCLVAGLSRREGWRNLLALPRPVLAGGALWAAAAVLGPRK